MPSFIKIPPLSRPMYRYIASRETVNGRTDGMPEHIMLLAVYVLAAEALKHYLNLLEGRPLYCCRCALFVHRKFRARWPRQKYISCWELWPLLNVNYSTIQGHRFRCQSKTHTQLHVWIILNLNPVSHRIWDTAGYWPNFRYWQERCLCLMQSFGLNP